MIGIGASAGGLDALERFLGPVPPQPGQAFVIVQHWDPARSSQLADLLQPHCALPVLAAQRGTPLQANHVYVLSPAGEQRNPIDAFFSALAAERLERAVGVLLSGMGDDGVEGLRAIRQCDGITAAQSPDSAEQSSMPQAAIDAGVVDVVARVSLLYAALSERLQERDQIGGLDDVLFVLRTRTGQDFSRYKRGTMWRRTARRMQERHVTRVEDYTDILRRDAGEADALFHTLLIGETRFFRDSESWEQLATQAIPALIAMYPSGGTLRVWIPACSSGEEAYSMAIVFREALDAIATGDRYRVQIFATDLDPQAISIARAAYYPVSIAGDVSPQRLRQFFVRDEEGYRVTPAIREMVTLATHNVVADTPFTKMHLISCRNLLIYLDKDEQQRLLTLFHYCLLPDGLLFLGSSESTGANSTLFGSFAESPCIHRRLPTPADPSAFRSSVPFGRRWDDLPGNPARGDRALARRNEELESLNEQLASSRDEMESLNEELRSVNLQLQAKLNELMQADDDIANLLESTNIATLFLDTSLQIRRYTSPTREVFRLIPTDVGRPITDLASTLDFPDIAAVAHGVLRTLEVFERDVQTRDGQWFRMRVMPYRRRDDTIDGLVLTFTDARRSRTQGGHDE